MSAVTKGKCVGFFLFQFLLINDYQIEKVFVFFEITGRQPVIINIGFEIESFLLKPKQLFFLAIISCANECSRSDPNYLKF